MIDIQCSPLEDSRLSLNAQYVFSCLVLNDGFLVVDQSNRIKYHRYKEMIRYGYLSDTEDITWI